MKFAKSHEWVEVNDNVATVGVSDYAQEELGDIVYVELPQVGKIVKAGQEAAVLESTKAAADVYSPVSGEIIEVNQNLESGSELINDSPMKDGWIFRVKLTSPEELDNLMDTTTYEADCGLHLK